MILGGCLGEKKGERKMASSNVCSIYIYLYLKVTLKKTALWIYNSLTIKSMYLRHNLIILMKVYIHETIATVKIVDIFITFRSFLLPLCNLFLTSGNYLLLLYISLQFLTFSVNGIAHYVFFFCLAYFTHYNYFETHPCCCIYQ